VTEVQVAHGVGVEGMVVPVTAEAAVTVSFDGQDVWSFRPSRDGVRTPVGWAVAWPPALASYLHGTTRVVVTGFDGQQVYAEGEVAFDDRPGRVSVRDRSGNPLMVNKVGTLSRAFDAVGSGVRQEILEGSVRILDDLRGPGAVDAYLNYGALLGALRTGEMIGHDCDVDLCYLSRHQEPVDVILESYRLERVMRARGWDTVRMSGADFKVRLPVSDGRIELVDVFAAFHVAGRFFQLGNRSGALRREDIVPTSSVQLEGVEFPAPARPEVMMAFLYGPEWRVPDPAFRYDDPRDGVRRLDGWLRGVRTEQPLWNRFYTSPAGDRVPRKGSAFARWVRPRLAPGAPIGDLGSGNGRDSRYFAARGHAVRSLDCSPEARTRIRRLLRRSGLEHDVGRIQLNELRTVLTEALTLRGSAVYARGLLDCVDDRARDNLWRLSRVVGGPAFLEFSSGEGEPHGPPGLVRRLDPDLVVAEALASGATLVHREDGAGTDLFDQPDRVTRLHLDFTKDSR
jgi:hypothetical protein